MAVLSDLPPHHQVLIDAINASARADPTLVNLQKVFNGLSEADKAALIELASQNPEPPAPLNPEQQAEFTKALGQEIAAAKKHLHWDAEKCAKACKKAANDFLNLVNKLSVISARDRSKESQALLIDFQALEKKYRELLSSSRTSAIRIAHQAERFDLVIVRVAADDRIDIDRKTKLIDHYIEETSNLEHEADGIQKNFGDFQVELVKFVARFGVWATKKEGDLQKEIQTLNNEIAELKDEIDSKTKILYGIAGGFCVGVHIGIVAAWCCPVAAPFIIGAGLVAAGITITAVVTLAVIINDLQKKVSNKQEEVSGKENELTNISQSRQNLVTLGEALSGDVGHVISIVSTAWKNCHNDAIAIKRWLDDGKQDADLPMYMACDLGHADGLYSAVGSYLRRYADSLADTSDE